MQLHIATYQTGHAEPRHLLEKRCQNASTGYIRIQHVRPARKPIRDGGAAPDRGTSQAHVGARRRQLSTSGSLRRKCPLESIAVPRSPAPRFRHRSYIRCPQSLHKQVERAWALSGVSAPVFSTWVYHEFSMARETAVLLLHGFAYDVHNYVDVASALAA
jgi:hypothetical protein